MKTLVNGLVLLMGLLLPVPAIAGLPAGSWSISGEIVDVETGTTGQNFTNTLTLAGHYDNGHFLVDLTPVDTLDNIAESAGWDGEFFRLIQRFSDLPGPGHPRDRALGYVEPDVFSRYATHALTSVIIAFADSNMLANLAGGRELVILGGQRRYPEEDNVYKIGLRQAGGVEITAVCPGEEIDPAGRIPVKGFEGRFTRWIYKSTFSGPDEGQTNAASTLLVDYRRFMLADGKLFEGRQVSGKISLLPEAAVDSDFRPVITETPLTVLDYSGRPQLFPLSKGVVDQNLTYKLTDQLWDHDRKTVVAAFAERKAVLARGIPKQLEDVVHESPFNPQPRMHRFIIGIGLVLISVPFAWAVFRPRQNAQDKVEQTT